jgi:hypothetical protein
MRISSIRTLFKDYNAEAADECVAFVYSQSHLMKEAVDREGLDCEFELRRTYDVFVDEQDAKDAGETYRTAVEEGHKWVKEVSFVDSRYAEQVCLSPSHPLRRPNADKERSPPSKVQKPLSVCLPAACGHTSSSHSFSPA